MHWSVLVDKVRSRGRYADEEQSKQVIRAVLWEFGGHLPGGLRSELAACLPEPAAASLTDALPATQPLTGAQFVDRFACRTAEATAATARWDVGSVLSVVADLAGDDLVERILAALPSGYALLFGRAELTGTDRPLNAEARTPLRRLVPPPGLHTGPRPGRVRATQAHC